MGALLLRQSFEEDGRYDCRVLLESGTATPDGLKMFWLQREFRRLTICAWFSGYVGVLQDHPFYGLDLDTVGARFTSWPRGALLGAITCARPKLPFFPWVTAEPFTCARTEALRDDKTQRWWIGREFRELDSVSTYGVEVVTDRLGLIRQGLNELAVASATKKVRRSFLEIGE